MPRPESHEVPRRVWKATALQIVGRIFSSLCTLAALAILSRHLTDGGFGRFTFYLAAFALLDSLTDLGTGQVAVQRTAAAPERVAGVLRAARRIRLASASLGLALVALLVWIFREPGGGWILLAALYPLSHVFELSITVFKNRIAWGIPVAVRALASALRLAVVLLLYSAGSTSAAHFLLGTAVASAFANLLLHLSARHSLPPLRRGDPPVEGLLRQALPLGLAALCQQAYFNIDNLFVRAIEGDVELGYYNGSVRLLSVLIMTAQVATAAALPWFARRDAAGDMGRAVARLGQPLFAVAGFGAGLLFPWSSELMRLVLGEGFEAAGPSLRWLLGATCIIYAGTPFLTAIVSTGRTAAALAVTGGALMVNVVGNALLVPALGIEGAAAATLVTEACVLGGSALVLVKLGKRPFGERPWLWLAGPVAFAAGAGLSGLLPLG